jgi:hypothetical protein
MGHTVPFKVKAIGPTDRPLGYYNHVRRHAGDIFLIDPEMPDPKDPKRVRKDGRTDLPLAFSTKYMEKVDVATPLTFAQEARPDFAPKSLADVGAPGDPVRQPPQAVGTILPTPSGDPVTDQTPL